MEIISYLSEMPILLYQHSLLTGFLEGHWIGIDLKKTSNPPAAIFYDPLHYMIITKGDAAWELRWKITK